MRNLIFALALFATPAMAQDVTIPVTTSTAKVSGPDCKAQAIHDYRSAWQQDAGRPYMSSDDSIIVQWAVDVAARGCEWRKTAAPATVTGPTFADGFAAAKAKAVEAANNIKP